MQPRGYGTCKYDWQAKNFLERFLEVTKYIIYLNLLEFLLSYGYCAEELREANIMREVGPLLFVRCGLCES